MTDYGIRVTFDNNKATRQTNGNVKGSAKLVWIEKILGRDVTIVTITKDFDFKGEQQIFDKDAEYNGFKIGGSAKFYEKDANTVCVTGHLEVSVFGASYGHDLDSNCVPIT